MLPTARAAHPTTGERPHDNDIPTRGDTQDRQRGELWCGGRYAWPALAGAHGSLVLNASGAFTYTINETDAAVQALRQSTDTLSDVFSYTMRDTAGAILDDAHANIHGANDAPTLAAQTTGQNATVGSAFSLVLPAGTFTDVDTGDSLAYTATAADGSALPAWLSFNAATRTFGGTPASGDLRHARGQGHGHGSRRPRGSETFNIAVDDGAGHPAGRRSPIQADACQKGGVANSTVAPRPATGQRAGHTHRSDAGDTKPSARAELWCWSAGTRHGARRRPTLLLGARARFTYTINETDTVQAVACRSTRYAERRLRLPSRDAAGAHPRQTSSPSPFRRC